MNVYSVIQFAAVMILIIIALIISPQDICMVPFSGQKKRNAHYQVLLHEVKTSN